MLIVFEAWCREARPFSTYANIHIMCHIPSLSAPRHFSVGSSCGSFPCRKILRLFFSWRCSDACLFFFFLLLSPPPCLMLILFAVPESSAAVDVLLLVVGSFVYCRRVHLFPGWGLSYATAFWKNRAVQYARYTIADSFFVAFFFLWGGGGWYRSWRVCALIFSPSQKNWGGIGVVGRENNAALATFCFLFFYCADLCKGSVFLSVVFWPGSSPSCAFFL